MPSTQHYQQAKETPPLGVLQQSRSLNRTTSRRYLPSTNSSVSLNKKKPSHHQQQSSSVSSSYQNKSNSPQLNKLDCPPPALASSTSPFPSPAEPTPPSASAISTPIPLKPMHPLPLKPQSATRVYDVAVPPKPRKKEDEDVHSLSDQQLSDAYTFVKEVGFGNWGSVWMCKRKRDGYGRGGEGGRIGQKVAIKLVHRSKTPTTAARVRSLWNEMKVLRSLPLPADALPGTTPHPSIVTFESFLITPSYALVVMPFLDRLMPVGISEEQAKPYFRSLLSATAFLHHNLVSHNDIKPANVLLTSTNVPVLVDFGFATKWTNPQRISDPEPFISSIVWGTPEYLSPRRARGEEHDERTSDVWSLGVTMFEILTGRTPFEGEGEEETFTTADGLQIYWERTSKGQWVGSWNITSEMEGLLRAMIHPSDDNRYSAQRALDHPVLREARPIVQRFYSSETQSATLPHLPFPLPFASPSSPALASSNSCPAQTDLQHSASEFGVYSPPRKQPLIPSGGSPQKQRGNGAGAMSLRGSPLRGGGKKQHALRGEARGEGGGAFGNGGQHMRLKAFHVSPVKKLPGSPARLRVHSTKTSPLALATIAAANNVQARSIAKRPSLVEVFAPTMDADPFHRQKLNESISRDESYSDISAISPAVPAEFDETPSHSPSAATSAPTRSVDQPLSSQPANDSFLELATDVKSISRSVEAIAEPVQAVVTRERSANYARRHSKVLDGIVFNDDESAGQLDEKSGEAEKKTDAKDGTPQKKKSAAHLRAGSSDLDSTPKGKHRQVAAPLAQALTVVSPTIQITDADTVAALDSRLDRISQWVQSVERIVIEARTALHEPRPLPAFTPSTPPSFAAMSPPVSPPANNSLTVANANLYKLPPHPNRFSSLPSASNATPTKSMVDGHKTTIEGGRPLADVPESVGAPSPARSAVVQQMPVQPTVENVEEKERVEEGEPLWDQSIRIDGFPNDSMRLKSVDDDTFKRPTTKIKQSSSSKLFALFQPTSAPDPKAEKAAALAAKTERLDFLKFPPPENPSNPTHYQPSRARNSPHYSTSHSRSQSHQQTSTNHRSQPSAASSTLALDTAGFPAPPSHDPRTSSKSSKATTGSSFLLRTKKSLKNMRSARSASHLRQSPSLTHIDDEFGDHLATTPNVERRGFGWASPPPPLTPPALPPTLMQEGRPQFASLEGGGPNAARRSLSRAGFGKLFGPAGGAGGSVSVGMARESMETGYTRSGTPFSQWTDVTAMETLGGGGEDARTVKGSKGGGKFVNAFRSLGFGRGRKKSRVAVEFD